MQIKKIMAGILSAGLMLTSMPFAAPRISAAELPNPVLKVSFDDATAKDSSGKGNNGTVAGSPEFVNGVSGKAIHLQNPEDVAGSSSPAQQYVDFGKPADLQFGEGNFSLAFWYKSSRSDSVSHKEGAVVSNKDWNSGNNLGFNIGDMKQGVNLNFNTDISSSRKETDRFAQAIDGKWHHIAATFDRKGSMTLYIDGKTYEAGNFNSSPAAIDISDRKGTIDAFNFILGADGQKQNSVLDIYLDELAVFKEALTTEQVALLAEPPETVKAKPVLKVSFDDATVKDSSGKNHDGVAAGSPEFVDGVSGKAIRLQNANGVAAESVTATQYVSFGGPDDLKFGADDFSILFWYKSNGDDPEEVAVVSNKNWDSGGNPGFTIGDMRNGMTLNFAANGGSRQDTSRITAATDNTWHHIAAVFNRTGNMNLYVDGQQYASTNISGQSGKTIDVADFVLGADGMKKYGVKDSSIDELMVYKTALSPEEISDYNAPFVLRNRIAQYEQLADESTASAEKVSKFKASLAEIKKQAQGESDLAKIAALTELLKKAFNEFTGPDNGIINFEVISDTHIPGTDNNNATNKKMIDVFEDLKRDYPDNSVVLNGGDMSQDGNETQMQGYYNILSQYNKDFNIMTALGNHDVRWKSGWDEIYERYMRMNSPYMGDTNGKVYYDKWIDGYHFIVLNTEWDVKDRAYISPEQLMWLDKTMAQNADPSKPIFIAFHQAMRDTYAISSDWSVGVQDFALKEVLRKYPQNIMFTGHIHDGLGAIEVINTDYGTMVDVPSLKDNDQGDSRGQLGFHVTVYDGSVRLDLRDYLNNEWVPGYSYTISMDPASRPLGKVLDVNFDDGTAKDISGNGNNGTLIGKPEFVDMPDGGKALHITNSDAVATQEKKAEQYVDFGSKTGLRFGEENFTLLFRYKGATAGDGDGCVIGNKNWNSGGNPGFAVGAFAGGNKGLGLNFNTEGGTRADTSRYSAATDGQWHNIAAAFDRSGTMTLYIDGKAAGSKDISAQAGKSVDVSGMSLILGADGNGQNSVRDMYIDDLKIYRKLLKAPEIETTWNPYVVKADKTSITISWPLPTDSDVEPAYLVLNGKKAATIASGETSKTISGLTPGTQYTVLLVNHEKTRPNNYQDAFPFVVTTQANLINKTALDDLYKLCKDKAEASYTPATWGPFKTALDHAKTVLDNTNATQKQVDDAKTALDNTAKALTARANTTILDTLYKANKDTVNKNYTKASWSALQDALSDAKTVLGNLNATQQQVDDAANKLDNAVKGLEKAPINLNDKDSGVMAGGGSGVLPDDAVLIVNSAKDAGKDKLVNNALAPHSSKFTAWDISLMLNNTAVQPNGSVTISLPIPDGYNVDKLAVYYVDDAGKTESLPFTVKDGMAVFTTNHFSLYAVAERADKPNDNGDDNDSNDNNSGSGNENENNGGGSPTEKPATGDSAVASTMVMLLFSGAAVLYLKRRRK